MTALTLFQLAAEHAALAERLTDLELDPQTIADTLEAESGALEVKAANVVMVARNLETLAAQIKDAEAQMAKRRKTYEARAESLKTYVLQAMRTAGIRKIETPTLALAVRQNPPAVVIDGEVPPHFLRTPEPPPPAPDKAAIKEALKGGLQCDWARLEQSERLEIR